MDTGKLTKSNYLILLLIVVAGYFWMQSQATENLWFDWLTRHYASSNHPDEQILIIEIDDHSLSKLEPYLGRWPWPRSIYAELIELFRENQVRAIVFDILFSETDKFHPDADAYFSETAKNCDNCYFAASINAAKSQEQMVNLADLPRAIFADTPKISADYWLPLQLPAAIAGTQWKAGLINLSVDTDGVIRHHHYFYRKDGYVFYSLPARVIQDIDSDITLPESIRLQFVGDELVPYTSISIAEIYLRLINGERGFPQLKDKILLIGATATGLHDLRPTPLSAQYPAISLLATAMDNGLHNGGWKLVNGIPVIIVTYALMALIFVYIRQQEDLKAFIQSILVSVLIVSALWGISSFLLSQYMDTLLATLTPLSLIVAWSLSWILCRGFKEYQKRRQTLQTFSRFMQPKVVEALLKEPDWRQKMAAKHCQITVLFSDIRGFTTLSENRTPEEVLSLLNQYFELQVATIFKYQGTLDKFVGDAIMAFWGAPIEDSLHAKNALLAAAEMENNLKKFRQRLAEPLQSFDIGIGIHSGEAVVGMLGSEQRFDYTAIGDTVNLASRIEGLTKQHGRILVSETTKKYCEPEFVFAEVGQFSVKGRKEPVRLFKPILGGNHDESNCE